MASSTCVKCGNGSFELKEAKVRGAKYMLYFVQCSSCGGVVGVQEYYNIGARLDMLAERLGVRLD